jgi:putative ABC transport system substrate-binding protein
LGTNFPEAFRQAGDYLGRALNGEKPENLPVMQVTKMDLLINIKIAKSLGHYPSYVSCPASHRASKA